MNGQVIGVEFPRINSNDTEGWGDGSVDKALAS